MAIGCEEGAASGAGRSRVEASAGADTRRRWGGAQPLRDAADGATGCRACAARRERGVADGLQALLLAGVSGPEPIASDRWPGGVAHFLGLLAATSGALDVAAAHFEAALGAAAASGSPTFAAWTQLAYARVLLARAAPGDAVRARRLLDDLVASAPAAVERPPRPVASGARLAPAGEHYTLRCEGEYWALASASTVSRARGLRGFEYMVELLRRPHQAVYVIDLMRPAGAPLELGAADAVEQGLRVTGADGGGPRLDRRARDEYRRRWQELLAEQAAAERDNDPGRAGRVQREIDMLARELAAGTTRRGRGAPPAQERARVNVRNCVSTALRVIRRYDEPLWRHLANAIKTGTFCVYEPDRPIEWDL